MPGYDRLQIPHISNEGQVVATDVDGPAIPAGTVLRDRYVIERELGRGSFAIAHLARDRVRDRHCVVKHLALRSVEDWKSVELFEREAQVLARLNHPRIPKHRDFFTVEGDQGREYYLVQDYIRGRNLAQVLASDKRLMANEVLRIAHDVAEILAYLHRLQPPVIHRDIKPSNIILGPDRRAFLIDFGTVRTGPDHAEGSTIVGSYGYMPFEQFSGQASPASDIYALGATMIHLLTGRPPSAALGDDMHLDVDQAVKGSERLIALLERMVHPDRQQRIPDGWALKQALSEAAKPAVPSRIVPSLVLTAAFGLFVLAPLGLAAWHWPTLSRQATRRIATESVSDLPLNRNLLGSGRFTRDAGWVLPDGHTEGNERYLTLQPGQVAYRDIEIGRFVDQNAAPRLAVSVGARVQRGWQTKAAIAIWSEPDSRLLGEDTRDLQDPTRVIGRTIPLPGHTRTLRLVLYGMAAGTQHTSWSEPQVTYFAPEFVVHPVDRLPDFAHLALGRRMPASQQRLTEDSAWRERIIQRRTMAARVPPVAATPPSASPRASRPHGRRPSPPPAVAAFTARRPSPRPSQPERIYRWYDFSEVNSVGNLPQSQRAERPVRPYEPIPVPTAPERLHATFPTPAPFRIQVWVPQQAPPAQAFPSFQPMPQGQMAPGVARQGAGGL